MSHKVGATVWDTCRVIPVHGKSQSQNHLTVQFPDPKEPEKSWTELQIQVPMSDLNKLDKFVRTKPDMRLASGSAAAYPALFFELAGVYLPEKNVVVVAGVDWEEAIPASGGVTHLNPWNYNAQGMMLSGMPGHWNSSDL